MTEEMLLARIKRGEYPQILTEEQRVGAVLGCSDGADERLIEEPSGRDPQGRPTSWLVRDGDEEHLVACVPDEDRYNCGCGRFRKRLRGAKCRHVYAVLYMLEPPAWERDAKPPVLDAGRLPAAAADSDLPRYLTERPDAYQRSLAYVDEQFYPFLGLLLDHAISEPSAAKRGPGRPAKTRRAVVAALFVKVREQKTLRATQTYTRALIPGNVS